MAFPSCGEEEQSRFPTTVRGSLTEQLHGSDSRRNHAGITQLTHMPLAIESVYIVLATPTTEAIAARLRDKLLRCLR